MTTVEHSGVGPDLLHRVVEEHLEEFLCGVQDTGRLLPSWVERTFRAYLDCGQTHGGFSISIVPISRLTPGPPGSVGRRADVSAAARVAEGSPGRLPEARRHLHAPGTDPGQQGISRESGS
jgi:hypothetical protein